MKILFTVLLLVCFKSGISQDSTQYHFKEVGWTINLPLDFKTISSEQNSASVNRGKKKIENTLDTSVNVLATINLINARKSKNYFSATLTKNNAESEAGSANFIRSQEDALYRAMAKDAKVDSSSTIIPVGSKSFRKFEITVHINETKTFSMNLATRLYNGYYFALVYLHLDGETKQQIEKMLSDSRFSK